MNSRKSSCAVLLAVMLLLGSSAMASEVTFEVSEVDLGQNVLTSQGISGNEWITFGIDMNASSLVLYGPPNPDPFSDDNGVSEFGAPSFEIVFNNPVVNVEVDFWSFAPADSTITAFNPNGTAIQIETNNDLVQDTEVFGGLIKRLVIESDPGTLCVSNIRFEEPPPMPDLSIWGMAAMLLLLSTSIAATLLWRNRPTSS